MGANWFNIGYTGYVSFFSCILQLFCVSPVGSGMFVLQCTRGSRFPHLRGLTRVLQFQSSPKPRLPSHGKEGDSLCALRSSCGMGPRCGQCMHSPLSTQNRFWVQQVRCSLKCFLRKTFSSKPKKPCFQPWQPSLRNMKITGSLLCSPTGMCFAQIIALVYF